MALPDKWRTMRPNTSRSLATLITAAGVGIVWRHIDPEGWRPFGELLAYAWVIFPAYIAYIVVDVQLMEWFGRRDERGKPEQFEDPTQKRLDQLEAAINRLHNYVMDVDPELAEENRLEQEFMNGEGGMFAGMNHMEYVRDREKAGKRTRRGHSIWRDDD